MKNLLWIKIIIIYFKGGYRFAGNPEEIFDKFYA